MGESVSEWPDVWKAQLAIADFEKGSKPWAKKCSQPLEAGKGEEMDPSLYSLQRNTVLLTPWF